MDAVSQRISDERDAIEAHLNEMDALNPTSDDVLFHSGMVLGKSLQELRADHANFCDTTEQYQRLAAACRHLAAHASRDDVCTAAVSTDVFPVLIDLATSADSSTLTAGASEALASLNNSQQCRTKLAQLPFNDIKGLFETIKLWLPRNRDVAEQTCVLVKNFAMFPDTLPLVLQPGWDGVSLLWRCGELWPADTAIQIAMCNALTDLLQNPSEELLASLSGAKPPVRGSCNAMAATTKCLTHSCEEVVMAAVNALMSVQQHSELLGDRAADQLLFKAFSCVLGRRTTPQLSSTSRGKIAHRKIPQTVLPQNVSHEAPMAAAEAAGGGASPSTKAKVAAAAAAAAGKYDSLPSMTSKIIKPGKGRLGGGSGPVAAGRAGSANYAPDTIGMSMGLAVPDHYGMENRQLDVDESLLQRERSVKAGVLPLMQAFASSQTTKIGERIRSSGLVERCESQIEIASQKLMELDQIRVQIKEAVEEQRQVILRAVTSSARITGRKEEVVGKPTLEELQKIRADEEEAALEMQVELRQKKLQQLWAGQRRPSFIDAAAASGLPAGPEQRGSSSSERMPIADDIGSALAAMSKGGRSAECDGLLGEDAESEDEEYERMEEKREVDSATYELNNKGEPSDFNPLELPSISWETIVHTLNSEEISSPFLIVNNRKALTLQLLEHEHMRYTSERDPINRVVFTKDSSERPLPGEAAQYLPKAVAQSDHLLFESRMQGANLAKATQVWEHEYDLELSHDSNTVGHTQWFYFAVTGADPSATYKFNIVNLEKSGSLYNDGMRPLLYSDQRALAEGIGWHRTGQNIGYYKGPMFSPNGKPVYVLTFECTFPHSGDVCYMAHSVPYSLLDLRKDLVALMAEPARRQFCTWGSLCESLGGISVDLLTITADPTDDARNLSKKVVVLSARVHPGEANSSWMMRGALLFLTSPHRVAQALRSSHLFKVIPMLNPDGVVLGNYRCSFAGLDLNRQYQHPDNRITPEVFWIKKLVSRYADRLALYCDFHGHSRKLDAFTYGCKSKPASLARVLPWLIQEQNSGFSYSKCSYKVQKSKSGTGRVVVWRTGHHLVNCFTLEVSFAGGTNGEHAGLHFTSGGLEGLGSALLTAFHRYFDLKKNKALDTVISKVSTLREKLTEVRMKTVGAWKAKKKKPGAAKKKNKGSPRPKKKKAGSKQKTESDEEESSETESAGSDSDPCDGNLGIDQLKGRWKELLAERRRARRRRRRDWKDSDAGVAAAGEESSSLSSKKTRERPERTALVVAGPQLAAAQPHGLLDGTMRVCALACSVPQSNAKSVAAMRNARRNSNTRQEVTNIQLSFGKSPRHLHGNVTVMTHQRSQSSMDAPSTRDLRMPGVPPNFSRTSERFYSDGSPHDEGTCYVPLSRSALRPRTSLISRAFGEAAMEDYEADMTHMTQRGEGFLMHMQQSHAMHSMGGAPCPLQQYVDDRASHTRRDVTHKPYRHSPPMLPNQSLHRVPSQSVTSLSLLPDSVLTVRAKRDTFMGTMLRSNPVIGAASTPFNAPYGANPLSRPGRRSHSRLEL